MKGRSSSLDKIVSHVERTRAWFKGQSVLEKSQDREAIWRIRMIKDVRRHIVLEELKLGFFEDAWEKMVLENDRLAEARRRAEEEQDAAIAATAAAAAVALGAAPSPSPLSPAPRRSIGRRVTSTSTKASPSPDAVKRDYRRFFGSKGVSVGRSFLAVEASENEDVFSNYYIDQRPGRIPELPSARITSVLSLPHANIASLVKHLLPNASNSSKHKKKITALETYLGWLMELFSSTIILSRFTEILDFLQDASTQNPFPNADNHCLGEDGAARVKEFRIFRLYVLGMLCEDLRLELASMAEEEEEERSFEELVNDESVRGRLFSGFGILGRLEQLRWTLVPSNR
ncbi:hypothetical protein BDY24DRAFT_393267 [Mrakia frigida]|uniref:uncharacterized protein n=1 Tax=Mrakia frigida TaxID=29902 RepID=UPI003FCC23B2